MLDLDAIFNPDVTLPPRQAIPANDAGIRVEDLPVDWRFEWEERAAIREHDGGLPRERAEALALKDVIKMMRAASELLGHATS
jgi:hypothetical protein